MIALEVLLILCHEHGRCQRREVGAGCGIFGDDVEMRRSGGRHHWRKGNRIVLAQAVALLEYRVLLRVHVLRLLEKSGGLAVHLVAVGSWRDLMSRREALLGLELISLRIECLLYRRLIHGLGCVGFAGRSVVLVLRHELLLVDTWRERELFMASEVMR